VAYDWGPAEFDECVWDLCAALDRIPGIDIVASERGITDQAVDSFSVHLAAWSLDSINFLGTLIGNDGTRLCLAVHPWEHGWGHEIDDPYTLLNLIGGPSPSAREVAEAIMDALGTDRPPE
jgi:hypothetical protein